MKKEGEKSARYSPDLHTASREDIYYTLTMFPYPSGYGLHVGHASVFTINDVMARFKRLQGKTVFNPMGFDSFGLPTENYAMKISKPAYEVTEENIETFLKQMEALKMSFDLDRMVVTSTPEYYKRTQRIFQELYKAGLVYRDELRVNRCPDCQTVLANDQVVEGKCERCKFEIIQKKMPQWFIKITDYADRLLADLDLIDRPEETKIGQRNWIGRSKGAEIDFQIVQGGGTSEKVSSVEKHGKHGKHQIGTINYYNTYAQQYIDKNHDNLLPGLKKKYDMLLSGLPTDAKILELGSGSGRDADYIESLGYTVTRSDVSDAFIEYQQSKGKDIQKIDALDFNLGETFDVIIATAVLVHFDEQQVIKAMSNINNHLKKGGKFVFSYKTKENAAKKEGDTRFYWKPEIGKMRSLLSQNGFKEVYYDTYVQTHADGGEREWHNFIVEKVDVIGSGQVITVFTTRPDTLFGVTALVVAPENTILDDHIPADKKDEVLAYRKETMSKTSVQRQQDTKEKTGVFSGVYGMHPLTGENLPIWYADYVLPDYATGSVMLVPGHDIRDKEFAEKFNIEIIQVIQPVIGENTHPNDVVTKRGGYGFVRNKQGNYLVIRADTPDPGIECGSKYFLPGGGIHEDEELLQGTIREIQEETGYLHFKPVSLPITIKNYYYSNWKQLHRENHGNYFLFELEDEHRGETKLDAYEQKIGFTVERVSEQQLEHLDRHPRYQKAFDVLVKGDVIRDGILINSGTFNGLDYKEAQKKIIEELETQGKGKKKITYKLRDRSVSRQRYWGSPIPVYYDENGDPQLIPQDELPVELPLDVQNYKPKGKSPLEDHPTFPTYTAKDGKTYRRECDTLDTFMCSSFYFLRYPDAHNNDELCDGQLLNKMFPIELYTGGKEHTVGHLLYSRFIHKFLYDQGYVSSPEPFAKLVHQGMVLGADGRKMSKRWGNVIDPLDVIELYGVDAVRMYIMFMGPVDQDKVWNDNALRGMAKFLQKVEKLQPKTGVSFWADETYMTVSQDDQAAKKSSVVSLYHKTIQALTDDMEKMKFNTAVSKLMILVNGILDNGVAPKEVLEGLTVMLTPFAPEITEQLWASLGHTDDVHYAARPVADESKIAEEAIDLPIQVNGKMRGNVSIQAGTEEEDVLALVKEVENVKKYIEGKELRKVIYVQDKIINLIV